MHLDKNNILRGQLSYHLSGILYVLKRYHVKIFRAHFLIQTFLPSTILGENEKQHHP